MTRKSEGLAIVINRRESFEFGHIYALMQPSKQY